MESNTHLNEKLKLLKNESSNKLQDVLINYDEIYTLLKDAGHDTAELQKTIRLALQNSLVLMAIFDDNITKFISDREATGLQ